MGAQNHPGVAVVSDVPGVPLLDRLRQWERDQEPHLPISNRPLRGERDQELGVGVGVGLDYRWWELDQELGVDAGLAVGMTQDVAVGMARVPQQHNLLLHVDAGFVVVGVAVGVSFHGTVVVIAGGSSVAVGVAFHGHELQRMRPRWKFDLAEEDSGCLVPDRRHRPESIHSARRWRGSSFQRRFQKAISTQSC